MHVSTVVKLSFGDATWFQRVAGLSIMTVTLVEKRSYRLEFAPSNFDLASGSCNRRILGRCKLTGESAYKESTPKFLVATDPCFVRGYSRILTALQYLSFN